MSNFPQVSFPSLPHLFRDAIGDVGFLEGPILGRLGQRNADNVEVLEKQIQLFFRRKNQLLGDLWILRLFLPVKIFPCEWEWRKGKGWESFIIRWESGIRGQ